MAKSTKHQETVKSLEEFRAPWETADGSEAEIDKPKLRRYLHGLLVDKAKAQDSREDAIAELAETEKELETAQSDLEKANGPEAQKKIEKLETKVADLQAKIDEAAAEKELAELRADVLGGVPEKYAKHVTGTTREELEKSYEEIAKDFDLPELGAEPGDDDGDGDEDGEPVVRTRPISNLRNPADTKPGAAADKAIDFDKVADDILNRSVFG